jgi:hypothetical protein
VRSAVAALALALLTTGCSSTVYDARLHFIDSREAEGRPVTFLGLPLRTGQVVLSEAAGPYSLCFSLGTELYYDFTHAGILVMDEGEPYVYEMAGEYEGCGLDDTPADGIVGVCRRVPLLEYAQAYLYVEIFDPPEGVDREKVGAWARRQLAEEAPFDAYFDYTEHERLFCTEFVELALEAGGAPPVELVAVRKHPSLSKLLAWMGVQPERALPAGLFADEARSAAALGILPNRTAARCYFAAKAELHRRFTDDQLLGNVFEMRGMADIDLRPAVFRFLQHAIVLYRGHRRAPPREEITAAVRALAAEEFGVAEPPPERAGARGP